MPGFSSAIGWGNVSMSVFTKNLYGSVSYMHLLVKELVARNVDSSGFNVACTLVAQNGEGEVGVDCSDALTSQLMADGEWVVLTVGVIGRVTTGRRSSDPVIVDWLIGFEDNRDTLSCVDIDVLDLSRLMLDTIGFYERYVVVVNREGEERPASDSEDTEPVTLPMLDIDHSKWH